MLIARKVKLFPKAPNGEITPSPINRDTENINRSLLTHMEIIGPHFVSLILFFALSAFDMDLFKAYCLGRLCGLWSELFELTCMPPILMCANIFSYTLSLICVMLHLPFMFLGSLYANC